jgi:elongation factor P
LTVAPAGDAMAAKHLPGRPGRPGGRRTPAPARSEGNPVASILYSEVRKGMVILENGQLCLCVDRELRTPGNLPSKLRLRLKNIRTGLVNDVRVHPEDKVEQAFLETREFQFLYKEGEDFVLMDNETFDQITLPPDAIGEGSGFLMENMSVKVQLYEGKPLAVELPATVELKVTDTEPGIKGATASAQYKPATLETGVKIQVPSFINIGEKVQVDTREGKYLGRVK